MKKLFGYEVEKTNFRNSLKEKVEYRLIGKRGAKYQLIRHRDGKSFFIRNSGLNVVGVKGNYTIEKKWLKK